jgi:transitional endoplasmic reticulum ATPase
VDKTKEALALTSEVTPQMSDKASRQAVQASLRKMAEDSPKLLDYLREAISADEKFTSFYRIFKYRMLDGAVAFNRVMDDMFGTQGEGVTRQTMFGDEPPEIQVVETGIGEHAEAPLGLVKFPGYEATFDIGYTRDPELGAVSKISCYAPKRRQAEIEKFFDAVQAQLDNSSIYRGKAITAASIPGFFNADAVNAEQVVYAADVQRQLSANVWTPIRHAQRLRDMGRPVNRKVLLTGKYGTGKTLSLVLTAQVAVANGFTFITVRSDDDPLEALQTARMYAPAVVAIEDFDLLTADKDREEIDQVLDALDSVTTKEQEVIILFTTNFPEEVDMGALRPGRIDHIINFGELDSEGYLQLIRATIPAAQLAADLNYESVAEAFSGLYPAFATEAVNKAILYSLDRTNGKADVITTDDIVSAVAGVREQLAFMEKADQAVRRHPSIDDLLTEKVEEVMERVEYMGVKLTVLDE